MINVLFTDTHYGVKNNSMTWLNSQLDFIYNQFIPELQELKKQNPEKHIRLVHLGDVFDSRSTISTYVATKVRDAFKKLRTAVDSFIIIAGNHDFYSPNSDEVCSIELLLSGLNINIYSKKSWLEENGDLYLPWYQYQDEVDNIKKLIKSGVVKRIFTHADIVTERVPYSNIPIYSGHLHIPDIDIKTKLYNIGSCYSLNFADANQERGYYILENDTYKFIPNSQSLRFWRLYNEDVFNIDKTKIGGRDYIEVYINQSNMSNQDYIKSMNDISQTYKNIWIIPKAEDIDNDGLEKFEGYDIEQVIKNTIPDTLKPKFEKVLNSLNKSIIMKNE